MDTELVNALRESARRVLNDRCTSDQLHRLIDQQADPMDLWRTAGELGWPAIAIPEEYGGLGAGVAELAALQEELGRFLAPIPFESSVLVARAVSLWPEETLRAYWLPRLAAGESIGGLGSLSPMDSQLAAIRRGQMWRVTGECLPVLQGTVADIFLVSVATEGGPGLALICRDMGLETHRLAVADRSRTVARVVCQDLEVPPHQILCGVEGVELRQRLADEARILIASDSLGGAQATLDTTVEYLKTRVQFGKPIGSFQALKHRCADHKVSLETSRRLLERAKLEVDTGLRTIWASLAKFSICDCYAALAADGVQMHGGIGFTWEHNAHLFLKRALLNQYLFGNSAQQQDQVAELLLVGGRRL